MRILSEECLRWVAGGLPDSGWTDGEIAVEDGVTYSWNETQHLWEAVADNPEEAADYWDIDLKPGADIDGLTDEMVSIFDEIAAAWDSTGLDPTITSGTDGTHMPGSHHYDGNGLDLRTTADGLTSGQINSLAGALSSSLGGNYDVVIESDHIHVEYDPN